MDSGLRRKSFRPMAGRTVFRLAAQQAHRLGTGHIIIRKSSIFSS
jgi:hypothetical protein